MFKLDKSPVKNLTAFLNSWHYRNDNYIFAALGDACNIVNYTLKNLTLLQKNKLIEKNQDTGQNQVYKGIAELLLYFYPSCRQKYDDNYINYNPLNLVFDYMNNEFIPNEPTSYDQLVVFYSKNDLVGKGKAIDFYTVATGVTLNAIAHVVSHYIKKNFINKKISHAHTYFNITPQNNAYENEYVCI